MAVEEFSTADTAEVLETDEAGVKALVDQAASEIAEQVATNVLIIEDEPMIAIDIDRSRQGLGHDVCDDRPHATARRSPLFRKHRPGLVLADIQLADGSSGLDAVNEILKSLRLPVIFITAYPGAAADRRAAGADLPRHQAVPPETVKAVISQALFFDYKARPRRSPRYRVSRAQTKRPASL